ncbi:MAG: hypothetical protein IKL44_02665 [Clostridia bacterium]|nr:hypothetical protein [Clostridia bacterium]
MSAIEVGFVYKGSTGIKTYSDGTPYETWITGVPNSVGGYGAKHEYFNATEKVIKYVTFYYEAYNAVDDVVACQTTGETIASGRITGPIQPMTEYSAEWEVLWYNTTIHNIAVVKVDVEYMDGTEETFEGDDITYMLSEGSVYKAKEEEKKAAERAAREAAEKARAEAAEARKEAVKDAVDNIVGGLKGLFGKKK